MREKEKVTKRFDAGDTDNSRCLVIKSSSAKSWVCSYNDIIKVNTDIKGEWILLEKTFIIPKGVAYIQLRLSGAGSGEFRFDDVWFKNIPQVHVKPSPNSE